VSTRCSRCSRCGQRNNGGSGGFAARLAYPFLVVARGAPGLEAGAPDHGTLTFQHSRAAWSMQMGSLPHTRGRLAGLADTVAWDQVNAYLTFDSPEHYAKRLAIHNRKKRRS
jgi:hypothetical protein